MTGLPRVLHLGQLKDAISATLALGGGRTNGVVKMVYVHIAQE